MHIIFDEQCLQYSRPGHPESPARIRSTWEHLKDTYPVFKPKPADEADIRAVHTDDLVDKVKRGAFFDLDSPAYDNIYDHALLSAGAAIMAAQNAMNGTPCFSLMRPPGHHAERNTAMGFCYFNSIAVATRKQLAAGKKVAIIDFDVHHGNGTEDIFKGVGDVLYLSTHQSPLYPGTGLGSHDNCRHYPLQPGTDDRIYENTFKKLLDDIDHFHPSLIGVSAGFDGYHADPLANFDLTVDCYHWIGSAIGSIGKPVFSIMEGGYAADVKLCVAAYLEGLDESL